MVTKKRRRWITFLIVFILIAGAGSVGFLTAKNEPRIVEKTDDESEALPAGADGSRISADATVQWHYEYTKCAHHIYVNCDVSEAMVGMTFTELQQYDPSIKIVEFDSKKLYLKKTFRCYCPNHFILKHNQDELSVYRTQHGSDKQKVYLDIPIQFSDIDSEEQKVLEVGKVFCELSELESYLEDIET